MNQIDNKLPEIITDECHFAMLEFEINKILKELDCATEVNTGTRTTDYIYEKLALLHHRIKMFKMAKYTTELKLLNAQKQLYSQKKRVSYITDEEDFDTDNEYNTEGSIYDNATENKINNTTSITNMNFNGFFPSYITRVPDEKPTMSSMPQMPILNTSLISDINLHSEEYL